MKSGKIYNLGFEVELFIDKNYTTDYVLKTVIETIKNYFEIDNHMMGDSVFVGDLGAGDFEVDDRHRLDFTFRDELDGIDVHV